VTYVALNNQHFKLNNSSLFFMCIGSRYLHHVVQRKPLSRCHHCDCDEDTLQVCLAWGEQRSVLVTIVGGDLSLPTVIKVMVSSATSWDAVASFCEHVMLQKEAAVRVRENVLAAPICRRRIGWRRSLHSQMQSP
jgi:hypothetical protein